MELWVTATITAATFLISLFNAAIGPTGGLQLALVAGLLPPQISIPTHAVITGVSSLARAIQLREYIDWALFWRFVPTSVAGTAVASFIFVQIDEGILLAIIGLSILLNNFVPYQRILGRKAAPFMDSAVGLITGLLTVFIGATGPLIFTYIAAGDRERRCIVATAAACMTQQHLIKVVAFTFISALLFQYAWQLLIFAGAAILGTRAGAGVLNRMSERTFRIGFKSVTSLIALYLVLSGLYGSGIR
ncbi:MAG: sulfite exporter TauE/SafE family protein [Chromatiaceae bacterium]|nr:sulfite exporter TauE/SafE family protein [Chromatiaceae bacterium]